MTELEIIQGVKKRNRVAQTAMFNQYKTLWYMISLRYNKDENEAQDALQNGLIKIYSNIGQFDPKLGSFKSWSSRIIVNENLILIRKRKDLFSIDNISEADHALVQEEEEPTNQISAEELTRLLQLLPAGYRLVFNLYVMEGYTHKEIASHLDISEGTSKSQLHKAKKLLQQKLEVLI